MLKALCPTCLQLNGRNRVVGYGNNKLNDLIHCPTDNCRAILFLCSKEAKWITGLIMLVGGGVSDPFRTLSGTIRHYPSTH
jgi:hypothetical protein